MEHELAKELCLPTIKQILAAADLLRDRPMTDQEAEEWFDQTVDENRRKQESEGQ